MRVLKCQFEKCGKEFVANHSKAKFCQPTCRSQAAELSRQRKNKAKKEAAWPRRVICQASVCGKVFDSYNPNTLYCSDECRRIVANQANMVKYYAKMEARGPRLIQCQFEGCAKMFEPQWTGYKYCDDCGPKAEEKRLQATKEKLKRPPRMIVCVIQDCNKVFEAGGSGDKYCYECRLLVAKEKEKERKKPYVYKPRPSKTAQCQFEGCCNTFVVKSYKKYCDECRPKSRSRTVMKHINKKRDTDPSYKIRNAISSAIRYALKNQGSVKRGKSSWSKLGYSPEMLAKHLEVQFEPGMSWDNYGPIKPNKRTWQVDHIRPQADLPYDNMDHPNFKKCWALENLRPYWADLNQLDGARRTRHTTPRKNAKINKQTVSKDGLPAA